MAVSGSRGARVYTTGAVVANTIDTEAEFFTQTWVEIGLIESVGEFGRMFETATLVELATGRTLKVKASYNDGQIQIVMGQDLSDAGQLILDNGAIALTQSNFGYRIEMNDAPSSTGGPSTFFFLGKPMSFSTQIGTAANVLKAASTIEVDSSILAIPAAELYDQFPTGGSLTHYELFKGSDAQAALPVISANTLVMVTGDVGTGFAADGSQAITDAGYTLSAGAVTIEARLKVSAITTVAIYFGLTDQTAALEMPIYSAASADTITTDASDGVGFMFDTSMSTDNIWLVGVNNNVDETSQNSAIAPVADTYITLRIEISAAATAVFYINGTAVGTSMTTACRTSVALYPTLAAMARSTSSRTMTVDYLYARQD